MLKQVPVPSRAVKPGSFQTAELALKIIISLIIPLAALILPEQ